MGAGVVDLGLAIVLGLAGDRDRAPSLFGRQRRHRRLHVIVEAAGLVIVDDEDRLGEHLGVIDEGLDQLGANMFPLGGFRLRVFGQVGGGDDP